MKLQKQQQSNAQIKKERTTCRNAQSRKERSNNGSKQERRVAIFARGVEARPSLDREWYHLEGLCRDYMSPSLNSLKGGYIGDYVRITKGETRSSDYSSYRVYRDTGASHVKAHGQ